MMNKQQTTKDGAKIQDEILRLFRSIGWDIDDIVPVATKAYKTVIGLKQANVWVKPTPNDGYCLCLIKPDYESEGRNILATSTALITDEVTDQKIRGIFNAFIKDIEERISQSYAVRLL